MFWWACCQELMSFKHKKATEVCSRVDRGRCMLWPHVATPCLSCRVAWWRPKYNCMLRVTDGWLFLLLDDVFYRYFSSQMDPKLPLEPSWDQHPEWSSQGMWRLYQTSISTPPESLAIAPNPNKIAERAIPTPLESWSPLCLSLKKLCFVSVMPQNVRVPENNSWEVGNRGSLTGCSQIPSKGGPTKGYFQPYLLQVLRSTSSQTGVAERPLIDFPGGEVWKTPIRHIHSQPLLVSLWLVCKLYNIEDSWEHWSCDVLFISRFRVFSYCVCVTRSVCILSLPWDKPTPGKEH